MCIMELISKNLRSTKKIAKQISKMVDEYSIITLTGDLGAGKTTFTKFLLKYLKVKDIVSSPTFTIVKMYHVGKGCISHFDLYRINNSDELRELGFAEMLDQSYLSIIEWPNIAQDYLKRKRLDITIKFDDQMNRVFNIEARNE